MIVSVLMPAFNADRFIERAILSLLREREIGLSIIVVDDGSSDRTADVVEMMSKDHPEIVLVRGEHRGVAAARNRAIESLSPTSEFITFLDADDLAFPGRIGRQLARLRDEPEAGAVIGKLHLFDELDEGTWLPRPGSRTETVRGISLSAVLFRREIFDRLGRFDETMRLAEDADFLFRLYESHCRLILEEEISTLYRRHDSNITSTGGLRLSMMRAIHKSVVRRRETGGQPLPPGILSGWVDG